MPRNRELTANTQAKVNKEQRGLFLNGPGEGHFGITNLLRLGVQVLKLKTIIFYKPLVNTFVTASLEASSFVRFCLSVKHTLDFMVYSRALCATMLVTSDSTPRWLK